MRRSNAVTSAPNASPISRRRIDLALLQEDAGPGWSGVLLRGVTIDYRSVVRPVGSSRFGSSSVAPVQLDRRVQPNTAAIEPITATTTKPAIHGQTGILARPRTRSIVSSA